MRWGMLSMSINKQFSLLVFLAFLTSFVSFSEVEVCSTAFKFASSRQVVALWLKTLLLIWTNK